MKRCSVSLISRRMQIKPGWHITSQLLRWLFSKNHKMVRIGEDVEKKQPLYTVSDCEFSSVQLLSRVQLFATPWIAARQASLSLTNSRSSLRLKSIESVMPSSHLILCRPLLLLPPVPPSIRVFSNESTLRMRWPKYWSFSFSIIPSKEIPGLISFRMEWLDLLAVLGSLECLLQHHSSKALMLQHSAFFTVQLSHPYMTTGKTIALTRRTFVGKGMSLLLNMLSRLVIIFLPRSKHLLISWLQSPSAAIWEPQKRKSDTVSTVSPSNSHEVMGPDAMIFVFWMLGFKSTFSLSSFTFIKVKFVITRLWTGPANMKFVITRLWIGPANMENNTKLPQKSKNITAVWFSSAISGYISIQTETSISKKYLLKKVSSCLCSLQHYSQKTRYGSNLNVLQQMNG